MPYEIKQEDGYLCIILTERCETADDHRASDEAIVMMEVATIKYAVFELSQCDFLSLEMIAAIEKIQAHTKNYSGGVKFVAANNFVKDTLLFGGFDLQTQVRESMRGALLGWGLAKKTELNVKFINPFLVATQELMLTQCGLAATALKPYAKRPDHPLLLGDLSGVIPIESEAFKGTLSISLEQAFFLKIAEILLGEQIPELRDEHKDMVCELANIVLGQAKIVLGEAGFGMQRTLPICVMGSRVPIKKFGPMGVGIVVPFETSLGIFHVEVTTQKIGA